jgi:predicted NAD/FAD-dependent oxidoreductase
VSAPEGAPPELPRRVDVCVVGAGFAGLRIAAALEEAGADYVVLDKGRSPGGRAATRRISEARVDHGIPWLTRTGRPSGGLSDELIDRLRDDGLIERTYVAGSVGDAWSCPEGINRIAKHLAEGLRVMYSQRVEWVEPPRPGGRGGAASVSIRVAGPDGTKSELRAGHLVVTAPVPQALEMAPFLAGQIGDPDPTTIYEKAVLGLARLRHSGDIPDEVLFENPADGIESVIMESAKFPDRPPSLTIRCDPAASDELFDRDDESAWQWMAERVADLPFLAGEPEERQVKRWRYSRPARPVAAPFVTLEFPGGSDGESATISACGDGFDSTAVTGIAPETGLEAALASAQALLDRRPW